MNLPTDLDGIIDDAFPTPLECTWCGENAVPRSGFAICENCGYAHKRVGGELVG